MVGGVGGVDGWKGKYRGDGLGGSVGDPAIPRPPQLHHDSPTRKRLSYGSTLCHCGSYSQCWSRGGWNAEVGWRRAAGTCG